MTDKDLRLIEKAWKTSYLDFGDVDAMLPEADTEEARERLRVIAKQKYLEEEYRVGGY